MTNLLHGPGLPSPLPVAIPMTAGTPTHVFLGGMFCPFCEEDSGCKFIHLRRAVMNTRDKASSSGPSLHLEYECEAGHQFTVCTTDHSAGT
jgi:hypothetical protein